MKNSSKFNGIEDRHIEIIKERYLNLIRTITFKIGGDGTVSDSDDYSQELLISAMDAMEAFRRLQFPELSYDEILDHPGFNKYIKSCLWAKKGKMGSLITKKIINGPIKHRFSDFDTIDGSSLQVADNKNIIKPKMLDGIPRDDSTGKLLVYMLDNIEDCLYLDYSNVWEAGLARQLKEKPHVIRRRLESLKARIKPHLEEDKK